MNNALTIVQIVVSVLLLCGILMQQTDNSFEGALGGGGNSISGNVHQTRRGFDLFIFDATIGFAVSFVLVCLAPLFVK